MDHHANQSTCGAMSNGAVAPQVVVQLGPPSMPTDVIIRK
jgi:hypothetical protein